MTDLLQPRNFLLLLLLFLSTTLPGGDCVDITDRRNQAGWISGRNLHDQLQTVMDDIIGYKEMQRIMDEEAVSQSESIDGAERIQMLKDNLQTKLHKYVLAVDFMKRELVEAYQGNCPTKATIDAEVENCCTVSGHEFDTRFNQQVNPAGTCYWLQTDQKSTDKIPITSDLSETLHRSLQNNEHLKWQYYGTREGVTLIYPSSPASNCDEYDPRLRPWYVEAATSVDKDIVLVVDKSSSMEREGLMDITRSAAKTVLHTMNSKDRIGIVAFSNDAQTPPGSVSTDTCFATEIAFATPRNKEILEEFIDNIRADSSSSYITGLRKAFSLFGNSPTLENRRRLILFLSDGEPSDQEESIYEQTAEFNRELNNSVVIYTYGIGANINDKAARILSKLAAQNWTTEGPDIQIGSYTHVFNPENLKYDLASYYDSFSLIDSNIPTFTVPYLDGWGLGMVMSICQSVHHNAELKGVACVDIVLEDILAEVEYDNTGEASYVFIINDRGRTMYHPRLPFIYATTSPPTDLGIEALEANPDVASVIESMKRREVSSLQVTSAEKIIPRGSSTLDGFDVSYESAVYYWAPIDSTDFSICLVLFDDAEKTTVSVQSEAAYDSTNFIYNRLDLELQTQAISTTDLCSRATYFATKATSAVQFSARAFTNPYKYLTYRESAHIVSTYRNYMLGEDQHGLDDTGVPIFRASVRDMVTVTSKIDDVWKQNSGEAHKFVARYIGSANGMSRVYPGQSITRYFDPLIRPWYKKALAVPDKLALSSPYLDINPDIGLVTTISKTIFRGRASGSHGDGDAVVGVIAGDVNLVYLYHKLLNFSACAETEFRCFLVDTSGFLVFHPVFQTTTPASRRHLVQEEPAIAEYLTQSGLIRKDICLDFKAFDVQNIITWKIDLAGQNTVEHLGDGTRGDVSFEMQAVPNTNVYLVIAHNNEADDYSTCAECHQDESTRQQCTKVGTLHCECPCYEPLKYDYCESNFNEDRDSQVSCFPQSTTPDLVDIDTVEETILAEHQLKPQQVPPCFTFSCDNILKKSQCSSADSCDWCMYSGHQLCVDKGTCTGDVYNPLKQNKGENSSIIPAVVGSCVTVVALVIIIIGVKLYIRKKQHTSAIDKRSPGGSGSEYALPNEHQHSQYMHTTAPPAPPTQPHQLQQTQQTLPQDGAAGSHVAPPPPVHPNNEAAAQAVVPQNHAQATPPQPPPRPDQHQDNRVPGVHGHMTTAAPPTGPAPPVGTAPGDPQGQLSASDAQVPTTGAHMQHQPASPAQSTTDLHPQTHPPNTQQKQQQQQQQQQQQANNNYQQTSPSPPAQAHPLPHHASMGVHVLGAI